jgi:nitrite reductase/ring-hydroxylating ferredoxin subunit
MVEWYQPDLAEVGLDSAIERLRRAAAASQVRLLVTLNAPSDETVFVVLAADSAEAVINICQHAGWHADRITSGVQALIHADERCGEA